MLMIRILIVGDIRLYSEGLAEVLGREREMEIVGIAGDRHDCLDRVRDTDPDVALIDMAMPESLITIRAMRDLSTDTKVVALALPEVESEIIACAEAGVVGYVPREASLPDLIAAVSSVANGECRCSPRVAVTLVRRISVLAARDPVLRTAARLTAREAEIVALIDRGLSNKEIAKELVLSPYTVKNHIHKALRKLKVRHRGQAAAWMRRELARRPVQ